MTEFPAIDGLPEDTRVVDVVACEKAGVAPPSTTTPVVTSTAIRAVPIRMVRRRMCLAFPPPR